MVLEININFALRVGCDKISVHHVFTKTCRRQPNLNTRLILSYWNVCTRQYNNMCILQRHPFNHRDPSPLESQQPSERRRPGQDNSQPTEVGLGETRQRVATRVLRSHHPPSASHPPWIFPTAIGRWLQKQRPLTGSKRQNFRQRRDIKTPAVSQVGSSALKNTGLPPYKPTECLCCVPCVLCVVCCVCFCF